MPCPDLKKLNKIFDTYVTALDSQSTFKKASIAAINTVKSFLPQHRDNEFIMESLDDTKKGKIEAYKFKFAKAAEKKENWVAAWLSIQDELNEDLAKVKIAEAVHESKFALALRAASVIICESLRNEDLFKEKIAGYISELEAPNETISSTEAAGYKASPTQVNTYNSLLIQLANYGEDKYILEATKSGLLDNYEKPDRSFMPKGTFNPYLSKYAEINTHVPWAYQKILPDVYAFRTTHHKWPSKAEWDTEKSKLQSENKDEAKYDIDSNNISIGKAATSKSKSNGAVQESKPNEVIVKADAGQLEEGFDEFALVDSPNNSATTPSISHTAQLLTTFRGTNTPEEKKVEQPAQPNIDTIADDQPVSTPAKKSKKAREKVEATVKEDLEKRKQSETKKIPESVASSVGKGGKRYR